jgi:hypothetical protein
MRKIKHHYTYNTILRVLGNYPELLLRGFERIVEDFRDAVAMEFERPFVEGEEGEGYGLIHGDFWLGKYVTNCLSSLVAAFGILTSSPNAT